jgi:dihydrofolate synthase/folylpolyglutamate synthase
MTHDYSATLGAMYGRAAGGIKLGLHAIAAALERLSNPQKRMKHIVVAGTNGKGSTSSLIASALQYSGVRVGHYSSPHLLRFTERIRVNGREISQGRVVELYARIVAVEPSLPQSLSFFEVATIMALLEFEATEVVMSVLEVGLGGRLDATNVVDKTLSVITPIGIDHEAYLGSTISAIAGEKAGIIAAGVPVVVSAQSAEADAVLLARARELGAPLIMAGPPPAGTRIPPGAYQLGNVGTAATACRVLELTDENIQWASAHFDWPGRYQWFGNILLDGAHNGHGIRALLDAIALDERARNRAIHLVATVLADKDPDVVLRPLADVAASVRLAAVGSKRTRSDRELASLGFPVATDAANAIADARARALQDGGFVLVAGSLFLIADALAVLTGAERDPPIDG